MTGTDYISIGLSCIGMGLFFLITRDYRKVAGYTLSLFEWMLEIPHCGCLLSLFLLVWVAMVVVTVIREVSGGRAPVVAYVAAIAGWVGVWWLMRVRIAHGMEQSVEEFVNHPETDFRRTALIFVLIGVILVIVGLTKL